MPPQATVRATAGLVAAVALLLGALARAAPADAATVYACVKKNGTAHIYAKRPKCHKREKRLSWNTTGPAGKNGGSGSNGAEGKEGKPGASGAVAGFTVEETDSVDLVGVFFTQIPGMSTKLPPGSFIASSYLDIHASTEGGEGGAGVICSLIDTPEGSLGGRFNQSIWHSAISVPSFAPFADGEIVIHMAFSASVPSTLSMSCGETEAKGTKVSINTSFGTIVAVQTTRNS